MKTTGTQKAKIGLFTLVGIGILVAGIFVIGQKKNMFGDTYHIYGKYRNVGGLQLGNNVRFAGINVGTVEKITILNDSTVKVDMRMQSKVRPFLKNDAVATIGSDGLMGDKLVTIEPGDSSTVLLENNQEIGTAEPAGFDKIVAKFSRVADNAEVITDALASIAGQISAGKGSLGKLIYTDSLERGLVSTINSAHATMQSAKVGVEGFSDNMTALKHNFLLKGYYKHKAKDSLKAQKKEAKDEKKAERKARRHGGSVADSTSH
jgi:phospholipid/cholesterol/gamma-HCH transport system substrate-binding protein